MGLVIVPNPYGCDWLRFFEVQLNHMGFRAARERNHPHVSLVGGLVVVVDQICCNSLVSLDSMHRIHICRLSLYAFNLNSAFFPVDLNPC